MFSSDQANLAVNKPHCSFRIFVSKIPEKLFLIIDSKTWRENFLKLGEFSLKKNIFKDFLNLVNFRPKKLFAKL